MVPFVKNNYITVGFCSFKNKKKLEVIKNILIHHSNKVKIKGGVIYDSNK